MQHKELKTAADREVKVADTNDQKTYGKALKPMVEIPYFKDNFFQLLKPADIHSLSSSSVKMKQETQDTRIKKLVTTLSQFATEHKIAIDEKLPLDKRLKQLINSVASPLKQFLEPFEKPDVAIPPLVISLLKPAHQRELFPLDIQMALQRIHQKLISKLSTEIKSRNANEEKLIAIVHSGIDVNEKYSQYSSRNLSLIAEAISRTFFRLSNILINDPETTLENMTSSIIEGFSSILKGVEGEITPEKMEALLNLIRNLNRCGFSAKNILQILQLHPEGENSVGLLVIFANKEKIYDDYLSLLIDLYEQNVSASEILDVLVKSDVLRFITSTHSANTVEKYLNFYTRLLRENPTPEVIHQVLSLFIPVNSGIYNTWTLIAMRGEEFTNATRICLNLLSLLFKITNDPQLIYNASSYQSKNNWTAGLLLSQFHNKEILKEYQDLLFDLAALEVAHTSADDEKAEPLSRTLKLLNLHADNYTMINRMSIHQPESAARHFELLRYLLDHGAAPDAILSSLNKSLSHNNSHAGFFLAERPETRLIGDYLQLLIDLLKSGANAKTIYELLLLEVQNHSLGMFIAVHSNNNENIVYHQLLNQLLAKDISSSQIIKLLKIQNTDGNTYLHILAINPKNANAVRSYQAFLLKLLKDKSTANEILQLLNVENNSRMPAGHYIPANLDNETMAQHIHLLLALLKNGIDSSSICLYLAKQNSAEYDFSLYLAINQHSKEVNLYLQLLSALLDNGAPANLICAMLGTKRNNRWDFFTAASRHTDFDFHAYFTLLSRLEKQVIRDLAPVAMIRTQLNLDTKIEDAKNPCEEIEKNTSQLTNEQIRTLYAIKPVTLHKDLTDAISCFISEYQINTNNSDVFENTLLTLSGIKTHSTFCQFGPRTEITDYPYTTYLHLGLSEDVAREFVDKLNILHPGLAKYSGKKDETQEIFLNIEILVHNILPVNGIFHKHLLEKIATNPLLLTSYQMECDKFPKIDFEKQILPKLINELNNNAALIAPILLKMANIDESIIGEASLEQAKKTEYADGESIALFKVAISPAAAHLFVQRLNKQFNGFSARVINDPGHPQIIAISKQLLNSDHFLSAFRESVYNFNKSKNLGIVHKSSPLFALSVSDNPSQLQVDAKNLKKTMSS